MRHLTRRPLSLFIAALAVVAAACGADGVAAAPEADHDHSQMQEWGDGPVPEVSLEVVPDAVAGWNLFADVSSYRFAPAHASSEHIAGEGHAHIEVDGERLARVYGLAFHIESLEPGPHEIRFTLATNSHSTYAVDGRALSASVEMEVAAAELEPSHMHHEPRDWDGEGAVGVGVTVEPDAKHGWNLFTDITGLAVSPRSASTAHVPGEGHYHIFVNGQKVARAYNAAFHIATLPAGTNTVQVRLSANDHSDYTSGGEVVAAAATVVVVGEASQVGACEKGLLDEPSSEQMLLTASYCGGQVATESDRYVVDVGSTVELRVVTDVADDAHLHGYNVSATADESGFARITFTANLPGVFEVELEDQSVVLFEIVVR